MQRYGTLAPASDSIGEGASDPAVLHPPFHGKISTTKAFFSAGHL